MLSHKYDDTELNASFLIETVTVKALRYTTKRNIKRFIVVPILVRKEYGKRICIHDKEGLIDENNRCCCVY